MSRSSKYEQHIRTVEDFPEPGVRFYDIAPLIGEGEIFSSVIEEMAEPLRGRVDKIAAIDARGFIFAAAMANRLRAGFVMLRKPGKLPGQTKSLSYDLEYGSNALEIQSDSLATGESTALIDDVIATGGTALAGIELAHSCGAKVVEFCSLINLPSLGGSDRILAKGVAVRSLIELGLG